MSALDGCGVSVSPAPSPRPAGFLPVAGRHGGWEPRHMRVLCATTANDGHFGPLVPFARACALAGHQVRVAAPAAFAPAVAWAASHQQPCPDAPAELVGPVMARLPSMGFEEAND